MVFARAIQKMHESPDKGDCLHEWSVDEIGDITDRDRWYKVNPSLGYQLIEDAIAKDASKMADDMFAREHLGYISKHISKVDYAISAEVWDACVSDEPKPEGKTAYGVKFTADGSEVCLCGAVIPAAGPARISLIERKPTSMGTRWLAQWLCERYGKAACVVIDGRNGADVLVDRIADVWKIKGSVIRPSARDVVAAAGTLTDALAERSVSWFAGQEMLRDSAVTATRRPISGGWGFGGENAAPIEAAALALWGAKTSKRDPTRRQRIG